MSYLDICIHLHISHALLFGDMDTGSIALGHIILCSTVPKSQLYGIASSKWVDYIYTCAYDTGLIYSDILTYIMVAEQIGFDQLCLNIDFIEIEGHGCIYIYTFIYICILHMAYSLEGHTVDRRSICPTAVLWVTTWCRCPLHRMLILGVALTVKSLPHRNAVMAPHRKSQ